MPPSGAPAVLLALLHLAAASPAPQPAAITVPQPLITPSPIEFSPTKTFRYEVRRNIFDDIKSGVHSALTKLGSAVPSYVASGKSEQWKQQETRLADM